MSCSKRARIPNSFRTEKRPFKKPKEAPLGVGIRPAVLSHGKECRTTMEKRKLGNSDMYITPVGVGAWAIGGVAGSGLGALRTTTSQSVQSRRRWITES